MRRYYFNIPWNVFDFCIVILSIIGLVLDIIAQTNSIPISPSVLRVLRVFRITRVLRLIEVAKGVRRLLMSLAMSLPALLNIGCLLFLVMFIYAIIGMSLFGSMVHHGTITDTINFETFPNAMALLFRLMTAAGWNDVLDSLMTDGPNCNASLTNLAPTGTCGNPGAAIPYMVTFVFITFLVLVNMYVAIILNNYQEVVEDEEIGITTGDIDMYYELWSKYDPYATQFIDYHFLSQFVADLNPPLKIPQPNKYACVALNLPLYDEDRLHCLDILEGLLFRVLGNPFEEGTQAVEEFFILKRQMEKKFAEAFPNWRADSANRNARTTMQLSRENWAAKVIQRAYRQWKYRSDIHKATYRHVHSRRRH
ncbi:uncharacterized protein TRIADDRAFT_54700 [Trichoplax adhaerens]|nr:hypothetical protein TRIADDRAFT_54700 [Trichoplax adhaerens]EDV26564.1 hypothetical protein TRIADDRAFT_54700 [Trichoplax adhaerens]|eukprot:XP_002110560.1 hypothetical protein TRIADDRAFT_54700 [Trichoplax adhaerens]